MEWDLDPHTHCQLHRIGFRIRIGIRIYECKYAGTVFESINKNAFQYVCVPSAALAVGGVCPGGVSARGCLPRGGCLSRGCLPRGCLSRRGGGCLPPVHAGIHTPQAYTPQVHPRADPPPPKQNHRRLGKHNLAATTFRTVVITNLNGAKEPHG